MRSNDLTQGARKPEFGPSEGDLDNPSWTAEMLERAQWGRRIRLYRLESRLSYEELADRTPYTVEQIIDWEKGRTLISADEFKQLCGSTFESPLNNKPS